MTTDEPHNRRNAVLALIVVCLLVLCGLWVSGLLHRTSAVQDCVLQGRSNC